jgi:hypothetical protein
VQSALGAGGGNRLTRWLRCLSAICMTCGAISSGDPAPSDARARGWQLRIKAHDGFRVTAAPSPFHM